MRAICDLPLDEGAIGQFVEFARLERRHQRGDRAFEPGFPAHGGLPSNDCPMGALVLHLCFPIITELSLCLAWALRRGEAKAEPG